jgi:hypothetical protein
MSRLLARVSSASEGTPDLSRVNEDRCYFCGSNDDLYILVVDGASVRINTSTLDCFVGAFGADTTAASYAAQITRNTIARAISTEASPSPRSLLLAANAALRSNMEAVYGGLTSEAVLRAEPGLEVVREDPRMIRLVLPVCVATIAHLDLNIATLEFAQAGDTALFVRHADDTAIRVTGETMQGHDRIALRLAKDKQSIRADTHIAAIVRDEQVLSLNRRNGLFHNYVDESGRADRSIGVGVINGLPELAEYIQEGTLALNGVRAVLACSDGFVWPAVWDESEVEKESRLLHMWQSIEREGLAGYIQALRALEKHDEQFDTYPRFKLHDDASAVYVELHP